MIRFVDLTEAYWTDPSCGTPVCAFLNTVTDEFLTNVSGGHTFTDLDDFTGLSKDLVKRCLGLVPGGFWDEKLTGRVCFVPFDLGKCSFLVKESGVYIAKLDGSQVFTTLDQVLSHPEGRRMFAVMPEGYLV